MKKIIIILWLPLIFLNSALDCFGQIYSDSSYAIESSPDYDYRNPVFNSNSDYFSWPGVYNLWLAYEKHTPSASNILIRNFTFSGYNNAVEITGDTSFLNINPSFAGDETNKILVWQSNKNGNWDIFFSLFQNGNWSLPGVLAGTSYNETNPYISFDPYIQNAKFAVAYEIEGEIWMKYLLNNGTWEGDTNATANIPDSAFSPIVYRASPFGKIAYLTKNTFGNTLNTKQFSINTGTSKFVFSNPESITGNGTINKLSVANIFTPHFGYSYDTLGAKNIILEPFGGSAATIIDTALSGDKSFIKGCSMTFITDENTSTLFFPAMALVRKVFDSTQVVLSSRYIPHFSDNTFKKFYAGNSSYNTRIGLSAPVFLNFHAYKMRVVWEQEINGRTALMESYVLDFVNNISNLSSEIPNKYSLYQNYPNPFNPATSIKFDIPKQGFVSLKVFDISGREAAELINEELSPGVYEYSFDGSSFGSGVYFYKLTTNSFSETKRMVLTK